MSLELIISEKFKKNPTYKKFFINLNKDAPFSKSEFSIVSDLILKYKNLIKSKKINILEFKSLEAIYDNISDEVYRNEKRNFALSFFSKKYQKLLNEKNIDLLYQLKEGGYNREDIGGVINKMAAYKSEKDLNDVLESTLETLNNYDIKGIEDKIKNKGLEEHVDILYKNHKEKLLLLNIKTYKASSVLGSKNWCISTSNYYFNMYVKNKGNNNIQLFAYDFKKPSNNKLSLIGFTVNNKNKVNILHAHNKV